MTRSRIQAPAPANADAAMGAISRAAMAMTARIREGNKGSGGLERLPLCEELGVADAAVQNVLAVVHRRNGRFGFICCTALISRAHQEQVQGTGKGELPVPRRNLESPNCG
jgi:hypothetical protein